MSPHPRHVLYPSFARFSLNFLLHLMQLDMGRIIPRGRGIVKFFIEIK
jgi:hypothetical protein